MNDNHFFFGPSSKKLGKFKMQFITGTRQRFFKLLDEFPISFARAFDAHTVDVY